MLAAITCRFNASGYKRPEANFDRFRASISRQVDLFVVELAYGPSAPFVVQDAWVKLRTDSVLWHKENLLNLLAGLVPEKYSAIAWVDSDITLPDGWPAKAEKMLELSGLVQLFSEVVYTGQDGTRLNSMPSMAKVYRQTNLIPDPGIKGHPGMGWAARRDFFEKVGLFDQMVVGGGDEMGFYSSVGLIPWFLPTYASKTMLARIVGHVKKANDYFSGLQPPNYVVQEATHLWHGSVENRGYLRRQNILSKVDPRHIQYRRDGLLEWSDSAPFTLKRDVGSYFRSRREDANDHDNEQAPRPVQEDDQLT